MIYSLSEQENNDIEMVENIPVEAPVDDDCHWKGGGAAEVVDEKQINAKLLKSRKKTPAKSKIYIDFFVKRQCF